MNTKNNKRKKESKAKIERTFTELLQTKELTQISVSDICKKAELNRSTFYANYADIYELADTIRKNVEEEFSKLYEEEKKIGFNSNDYLKLFRHIAENQLAYKTYFKLGYNNRYEIFKYDSELAKNHFNNRFIEYHIEFFKSGITAIIQMWLLGGCRESPEEMNEIIRDEYAGRYEHAEKIKNTRTQ